MWAISSKIHSGHPRRDGFTIVELLIVIVVIAILAAITIVAYNGIQNRAKASAAQSGAAQVKKKATAYALTNSDAYPATLAAIDVSNSETTYQYSVNNSSSPKTFCVTATVGTFSYWISSASGSPATGGCPGHGSGGIAPITNLMRNPSAETSTTGWSTRTNSSLSTTTTNPLIGLQSIIMTATASGASMSLSAPGSATPIIATPGTTYTASLTVQALDTSNNVRMVIDSFNGSSYITGSGVDGPLTQIPAGQTRRLSVTGTTAAGTTRLQVYVIVSGGSAGNRWMLDGAMINESSTLFQYADGESENWVWTGTPNASTSVGPGVQ